MHKIVCFIDRNMFLFFILLYVIFLLTTLCIAVLLRYRHSKPGIMTPQFYPPEHLSPSTIGFINSLSFSPKLITADLVQLATEGCITISHTSSFLWWRTYTLSLAISTTNDTYKALLLATLFSSKNNLTITQSERKTMQITYNILANQAKNKTKQYIKQLPFTATRTACFLICSFFPIFGYYYLKQVVPLSYAFVFVGCLIMWSGIIHYLRYSYTKEGRRIQDQIEGFKAFLSAREETRRGFFQTPPARTKELYQQYLPYAIALGVTKQWKSQFASVFDKEEMNSISKPSWYIATGKFYVSSFNANIFRVVFSLLKQP